MSKIILGLVLIILAILVFIGGPFASIWSLNTLFGFNIAITLENWVAAFWLTLLFSAGFYQKGK